MFLISYPKIPQPNAIVHTMANTTTMINQMSSFFMESSFRLLHEGNYGMNALILRF